MNLHKDGSLPENIKSVFVFGSNLAGNHGAGAALVAKQKFGAIQGEGIGRRGMSYAIPTKDKKIRTLPRAIVSVYIADFCKYTRDNPCLEFFITRVGCGLAGFKDSDIAPLFKAANKANCNFPEEWSNFL